jgi:hypothetical protein
MNKNGEPIMPALQVGKAAISLELQPLVERLQPGMESLL